MHESKNRLKDVLSPFRHFYWQNFPIPSTLIRKNLQSRFTHIIIISLSYPGKNFPSGHKMTLHGTKYDFCLLLKHFKYGDEGNPINFTLLNDFSAVHKDSTGNEGIIPKTDASKATIKHRVQSLMRNLDRQSNVLFYFGGHGVNEGGSQSIIAGDGQHISGPELRSWLTRNTRHRDVSVTAVFDACHSGGSLGLPYNYEEMPEGAVKVNNVKGKGTSIPMIQISAARREQIASSSPCSGGYYGQLTWHFVQHLNTTADLTIENLASDLYQKCDPSGAQLPQVSASF